MHLLMCCMFLMAQNNDLDKALKSIYRESWTLKAEDFDEDKKGKVLSLVTNQNYEGLSDSAKYSYHYFSAGISRDKNDRENEEVHIDKAVKLRESSMGILNPEYLELLMEQGRITEEYNIDKAISIYQKAVLVGQTIIDVPKAQTYPFMLFADCYGNIISALAELYDKKDWTTRIDELYKRAFRLHTYYGAKSDPATYLDINRLSSYYERKNQISKSIELLEWESDYIKESGFYGSPAYVSNLYFLGSLYSKTNQNDIAIDCYRTAVNLSLDSLAGEDNTLFYLYENYCGKLAELNQLNELDKILPIAQKYYAKKDSINAYANILYIVTDMLCNNNMFDKADQYCDSLLQYPSYHTGYEEVIYSKKALTSYMCKKLNTAIQWQEKALDFCLRHNGENSIIYTNYQADMAFLYKSNSMTEKALTSYLKVIELLEKNNRDTIPFFNQKVNEVCNLYNEEKNYEVEYQFLKERKKNSGEKYGESTPYYAWICNTLSIFEMNTGRLVEAKENNLISEKLYLNIDGRNSLNYAAAIHNKGRICMLEGKNKQALKYLKESKEIQFSISGKVFENTEMYIHEIEDKLK